mmetsp:Transcript_25990/g.48466  ORF Transcript_25990/g.48466 Transcript_25990/m.48466 type:complete len:226 (-) Transcript_25990:212-889(-)
MSQNVPQPFIYKYQHTVRPPLAPCMQLRMALDESIITLSRHPDPDAMYVAEAEHFAAHFQPHHLDHLAWHCRSSYRGRRCLLLKILRLHTALLRGNALAQPAGGDFSDERIRRQAALDSVDGARLWGTHAAIAQVIASLATHVPNVSPGVAHSVDLSSMEGGKVYDEIPGVRPQACIHRDPRLRIFVGVGVVIIILVLATTMTMMTTTMMMMMMMVMMAMVTITT